MKQETLEEVAEKLYPTIHEIYQYDAFIEGAKWQQEQAKEIEKEQIMRKQTAVEWLVEKLNQCEPMYSGVQSNEHKKHLDKLIEQAKEMEEQQIINAFDTGHTNGAWNFLGEEYYEKTFKNETK